MGRSVLEGRERPLANAFKLGLAEEAPRVPEDSQSIRERSYLWYCGLKPQTNYQAWVVDQISVTTIKIDRNGRIERRLRDRIVMRAELFWDEDGRLEAAEIGQGLARRPSFVVNKLKRTPQGCEWMLDRWAMLARTADLGHWDDGQRSLALDLLGAPLEGRDLSKVDWVYDGDGKAIVQGMGLAELARGEVEKLLAHRERIAESDELDRCMAEADMGDLTNPQMRRLKSETRHLQGWLRWLQSEVKYKSPHPYQAPHLDGHFDISDLHPPEPEPAPSPPAEVVAEVEEVEAHEWPDKVPFARDGAKPLKAETRQKASRKKRHRRRA